MKKESNIEIIPLKEDVQADNLAISSGISKILEESHSRVSEIVHIDLEKEETGIFGILSRQSRNYINWLLNISPDAKDTLYFAQVTETLNKQRQVLQSGIADNYDIKNKIAV